MTKFEDLNPKVIYDTEVINKFYQEMGYGSNNKFHDKIWRPYMCDYFMNGPYVWFIKNDLSDTIFDDLMREFFETYPELNDEIKVIFTN